MSLTTLDVLRLLSSVDFLSGQELARRLGCSRASIHTLVKGAGDLGVSVHAVQGRGYRLAEPMDWLDAAYLAEHLAPLGMPLQVLDRVASTNTLLLDGARNGAAQGAVLVAESQTQGRGRRGRTWLAPLGKGLTFSLLWRSGRPAADLSGLSLAVGVMLVSVLREIGAAKATVKWPNDIQVAGAKLAGVLIELTGDMLGPSVAVIGVGLNMAGAAHLEDAVGQRVTDLASQGVRAGRNPLLVRVLTALEAGLSRFEAAGFAAFQEDWNACHAYHQQEVILLTGLGERLAGRVLGVDESGALLLQMDGAVRRFHSGEVSLRGVAA